MSIFGVASFFAGVLALAFLVIRRSSRAPQTWMDHTALFVGIAGTILGLAIVFLRFS